MRCESGAAADTRLPNRSPGAEAFRTGGPMTRGGAPGASWWGRTTVGRTSRTLRGVLPRLRAHRCFNPRVDTRLRRAATWATTTVVACALGAPLALPSASASARPDVSWSDRNVVAGATVKAVVDRSSRPAGTRLVLQRRHLDKWRAADKKADETRRGYVLVVPTDQFGKFSYRVVAKGRNGNVVSRSTDTKVTVRPPYSPLGRKRQHTFADRPRVRWDSCREIRWVFNPEHSPKRALRQVRKGMRRIHLATGLDFDYVGRTDQKPNPYGHNVDKADLIIGWRTAKDFRPFAKSPGTVGLGGNTYYSGFQEAHGSRINLAVQGGVVLNASMRRKLDNGFGKGATWGEVIIHELGHVMGLAHTGARSQIMYYSMRQRDASWGAGDLSGFRRLGDVRGCVERTPARRADVPSKPGRFVLR